MPGMRHHNVVCSQLVTKEAELCQLNSKYLVLLAEMNKPRSDSVGLAVAGSKVESSDQDRKDMVKILIKEALEDTVEAAHAGWSMRRCVIGDRYVDTKYIYLSVR